MNETAARDDMIASRGLSIPLDRDVLTPRLIKALKNQGYENKEADAITNLVRPHDVVMELGGGIGYISSLAAKSCHKGEVHSFEANPHLIPFIKRVHAANDLTNVHVNNALLGPQPGSTTFYARRNLLASSMARMDGTDIISEEQVEIRDARSESQRIKPTILICDIEGAEQMVIPLLDLSTVRSAVIELHPQWIGADGVRAVFQAMMDAGLVYAARRSVAKVVCFKRHF